MSNGITFSLVGRAVVLIPEQVALVQTAVVLHFSNAVVETRTKLVLILLLS